MLLKKGIRHCWIKGAMPFSGDTKGSASSGRRSRCASCRCARIWRRRQAGRSRSRPAARSRRCRKADRGRRRDGRDHGRHLRRHPLHAHDAARRQSARHRRRGARQGGRRCDQSAGVVPGHGRARVGQRARPSLAGRSRSPAAALRCFPMT